MLDIFPEKLAILRKKTKLAALNKESHEEHPGSNRGRDTNVPRTREDYITQVSEKIESRLTKKLSQEFSKTESRIIGTLSQLDEFLLNPLIQGHSEFASETFWNAYGTYQETNED